MEKANHVVAQAARLLGMSYYTFSDRWEKLDIETDKELMHCAEFDFAFPDEGINFEMLEKELLKKAMEKANNVQAKAARLLNMSYKTFYNRWEKYNEGSPRQNGHL